MAFRLVSAMSILSIGLFAYSPSYASGLALCIDRDEAVHRLEKLYAEKPVARGVTESGRVFEVFASDAGTFTAVITMPDGRACFLMSGEDFEVLKPSIDGPSF